MKALTLERVEPDAPIRLHKRNARRHAQERVLQRYGEILSDGAIDQHEAIINAGKSRILGRSHNRRQIHMIVNEWGTYYPVFCPDLKCIVSYLDERQSRMWRAP